jgi:uncharacterized protein with HEPN domain
VTGRTLDDYLADEDFRLATERRLEVIGEAARRLSAEFRNARSAIPWGKVIGLRNFIAHEYDDVDDVLIWNLCITEIPKLIESLQLAAAPPPSEDSPGV